MLTTDTTTTSGLARLRSRLQGELVLPSDANWDTARQAFNLAIDQHPAAIVQARSADDVAATVRFAAEAGLRVAPQATGHNAGALETLEDSVLLKTTAMTGVQVDARARRARVNAGARWGDVVAQAAPHGLAALHGSSPDVGVVGYSLGGGMGWLARAKGLQTNSVTAVELVDADGELVRADAHHEPELFWALRGGGGNFGVVTALEFALHPVAELYAGIMFWPLEQGLEVLHAWRELLPAFPEEFTSSLRLMQIPPLEEIPEPLRGGAFVAIDGAFLGGEAAGADVVRPLRELAPMIDTYAPVGIEALSTLHMDPDEPMPFLSGTQLLTGTPASAFDDVFALAGPGSGSALAVVEFRHLGGALAREAEGSGALASLDGELVMFAGGLVLQPEAGAAIAADLERLKGRLAPWDSGRYLNFTEQPADTALAYSPQAYRRLRAAKAQYDPRERFRANHPIRPAA